MAIGKSVLEVDQPKTPTSALNIAPALGMLGRDRVTGLEGILTVRVNMLSGNEQFNIQPRCDPGAASIPEGQSVDVHMIEVIGLGVSENLTPIAESEILLGQKVQDIVSGFTGVVTEKLTFLNGCVYFSVLPKIPQVDNEKVKIELFEHKRLRVIDQGVRVELGLEEKRPLFGGTTKLKKSKAPAEPEKSKRGPGGPSRNLGLLRAR